MQYELKPLPGLKDGQSWNCIHGCGECKPVVTLFEYSREEDLNGNPIESRTSPVWVSDCCEDEFLIWDETLQDTVEWDV